MSWHNCQLSTVNCQLFFSFSAWSAVANALMISSISPSMNCAAAVDAPQLFESGYDKSCDFIIGVVADKDKRIERIKARDNIDTDTALARVRSQHSDGFFEKSCSVVFHNDKSEAELEAEMAEIIEKLGRGELPR